MISRMTFELATLLMFLNEKLRLIFSTLPMLASPVSSPAPTNNILVTYGVLQVLYCIELYCILRKSGHDGLQTEFLPVAQICCVNVRAQI